MILTAEFPQPESVGSAVSALLAGGIGRDSIEVFSAKPVKLPEALHRPSRASFLAVAAAILNGGAATAFIFYTQHDYPLVTGGMPLFSGWSTGVISFELTMAGAVAGTVLSFLWEIEWLRARRKAPPPATSEGAVVVRVTCPEAAATAAWDCLSRNGALEIARSQETA